MLKYPVFAGILIAIALFLTILFNPKQPLKKQGKKKYDQIITEFPLVTKVPDPADIQTAYEWYFLNNIASPLISFDHESGHYVPLLVDSWRIDGTKYIFHLRNDAKFHDGSPVTSHDAINSIKRLAIKKTSSEFPIWEYLKNCTTLKTLEDSCESLKELNENTFAVELKQRRESFSLLISSPEGSIWSSKDIDPVTLKITPRHFSGPYSILDTERVPLRLKKNSYSSLIRKFPNAPSEVIAWGDSGAESDQKKREQKIDIFIEAARPFLDNSYTLEMNVHNTTPSVVYYLEKMHSSQPKLITREFVRALWSGNIPDFLQPAETFLPFGSLGALSRDSYLAHLPETADRNKTTIAAVYPYYNSNFLNFIKHQVESNSPYKVDFKKITLADFITHYKRGEKPTYDADFTLVPYVASERSPSVQLRYILGDLKIPLDLNILDNPERSQERQAALQNIQFYMLREQMIIPLFFGRNQIVYRKDMEIGNQPINDADLQIWRINSTSTIQ